MVTMRAYSYSIYSILIGPVSTLPSDNNPLIGPVSTLPSDNNLPEARLRQLVYEGGGLL